MDAISWGVLIVLGFLVAVFFIMRQLMLWYWRIDEAIDLLRSIDASLKCLPAVREMRASDIDVRQRAA